MRRTIGLSLMSVTIAGLSAFSVAKEPIPASVAAKAIDADAAHLMKLYDLSKSKKKLEGRMKATALLIAGYAQDNLDGKDGAKMAGVRTQAMKIAEAAGKKDMATAEAATKDLTSTKGEAGAKPMDLVKAAKLDLHELMDLFGGSVGGGMNLEKDIRAAKKDGPKDAASAEIIAARVSKIADYTLELPPEFGGKKKKEDWEKWTKDMKKTADDILVEAAKGGSADMAKMKKLFSGLDGTCSNCHGVFRDE
ncbi:MAG: cytochrome c [Gemmataceae bacterium]